MNIIGLDALIFGVDDIAACSKYLIDYGLIPKSAVGSRRMFEALDGTAIILAPENDPSLPPPLKSGSTLRCTLMGVASQADLDRVATELSKDREVRWLDDGSLQSIDDSGISISFQVTVRHPIDAPYGEIVNAPGGPFQRPLNVLGVDVNRPKIVPRTLSHVVYFVPDIDKAELFYVERLGFRTVDRFIDIGPFLQPSGTRDHHTHFFIQAPAEILGIEHFTFHFAGPTEVIQNGTRFVEQGYQAFWGPGRHVLGSNWFWYFNSPFGCHMEMDADMDQHDARWVPRALPIGADASQAFLLRHNRKWFPGPDSLSGGQYA